MTTLLRIDASIRVEGSVSRALADSAEAAWRAEHPDGVVVRRDLGRHPIPADVWPTVAAARLGLPVPGDGTRAEEVAALAFADELLDEVKSADALLLAVPLYNYGISQHIKGWIDILLTDKSTDGAPPSLQGKPVILTLARGGGYGPGTPKEGWDHATPYLERIFGDLLGMEVRKAEAELTLAAVTPGMETLIDAAKVSEEEAHVHAGKHATHVARQVTGAAA